MLEFFQMIMSIDHALELWLNQYGVWIYVILFLIIFGETGFVILPFLPGDSLLFLAGTFSAKGSMSISLLLISLTVAAILGNTVNFYIGRKIGHKAFTMESRWINRNALLKTQAFYEHHGGKTIIAARFLPLVRTFAPFVAGISQMDAKRFQLFNISGAIIWIFSLTLAGYFFGQIPFIRDNLNIIVLVGIGSALIPVVLAGIWKISRALLQKYSKNSDETTRSDT